MKQQQKLFIPQLVGNNVMTVGTNYSTNQGGGDCSLYSSKGLSNYCDMTPERRKYAVRETQQICPLLDNSWLEHVPAATNTLV
jgi:hypothetical protein